MTRAGGSARRFRVAGGATIAVVVLSLILSASASGSGRRITFFDAPVELSGELGASARSSALDQLHGLGVNAVRYVVYWRAIAPSPSSSSPPPGFDPRDPNTYGDRGSNWGPVDAIVEGANARGLDVSLVLSGQPPFGSVPRWASGDQNGAQSDPNPGQFEDFAYAVGRRYRGGAGSVGYARYISVWNEPNYSGFLRVGPGQRASAVPALYRRLVLSAEAGLSAAGWNGRLLMGETIPSATAYAYPPLAFMRQTLCLNGHYRRVGNCTAPAVAGWAHHPYAFGLPPFRAPHGAAVTTANLPKMVRAIALARRAGALPAAAALYVTEFGTVTRPGSIAGVSWTQQAEYNSIAEFLEYRSPGVASNAQYLLRDDRFGGPYGGFASGLCTFQAPFSVDAISGGPGVGCKPAWAAFRTPLVVRARNAKRVTIWGHVRPARGSVLVQVHFRDRGGGERLLRVVRTDSAGYFSFPARNRRGRRWSISWAGLNGPFVRAYRF